MRKSGGCDNRKNVESQEKVIGCVLLPALNEKAIIAHDLATQELVPEKAGARENRMEDKIKPQEWLGVILAAGKGKRAYPTTK